MKKYVLIASMVVSIFIFTSCSEEEEITGRERQEATESKTSEELKAEEDQYKKDLEEIEKKLWASTGTNSHTLKVTKSASGQRFLIIKPVGGYKKSYKLKPFKTKGVIDTHKAEIQYVLKNGTLKITIDNEVITFA